MLSFLSRLAPALVALLVGAGISACGSVSSTAFDVEGQSTSAREFDRELEALVDNDQFVELYEQTGEAAQDSDGTVSSALAATWASLVVQQEIMAAAVEDDDVEVDEAGRDAAEGAAAELFGGAETFDAFPDWFRDRIIDRYEQQNTYLASAGGGPPSEEDLRAFYDENLAALVQGCPSGKFVSHILVASEDEAAAVVDALATGSPFEEVAAERSSDTSAAQGGFLDCYQEGQFVTEFEAAVNATPPGQTTAPVQTEFGWHVIKIDAEPSFAALRGQIESSLAGRQQQEAVRALLEDADVEVNPRYGTWVVDDQGARVEAPDPKVPESTEPPVPSTGLGEPVPAP